MSKPLTVFLHNRNDTRVRVNHFVCLPNKKIIADYLIFIESNPSNLFSQPSLPIQQTYSMLTQYVPLNTTTLYKDLSFSIWMISELTHIFGGFQVGRHTHTIVIYVWGMHCLDSKYLFIAFSWCVDTPLATNHIILDSYHLLIILYKGKVKIPLDSKISKCIFEVLNIHRPNNRDLLTNFHNAPRMKGNLQPKQILTGMRMICSLKLNP